MGTPNTAVEQEHVNPAEPPVLGALHLQTRTLRVGRKGAKETVTVQWAEYTFRSQFIPRNKYWVTTACVIIPSRDKLVIGASACSPEDVFDRRQAGDRALGRARQVASWIVTGRKYWEGYHSLLGSAANAVNDFDVAKAANAGDILAQIENIVRSVELTVSRNAERVAFLAKVRRLKREYPDQTGFVI